MMKLEKELKNPNMLNYLSLKNVIIQWAMKKKVLHKKIQEDGLIVQRLYLREKPKKVKKREKVRKENVQEGVQKRDNYKINI